jgi:chemotaxis protein histidine kinase CheA
MANYTSGSSILGNGEVALILDVPALIKQAMANPVTSSRRELETDTKALA